MKVRHWVFLFVFWMVYWENILKPAVGEWGIVVNLIPIIVLYFSSSWLIIQLLIWVRAFLNWFLDIDFDPKHKTFFLEPKKPERSE